jgi:hypothetical protein
LPTTRQHREKAEHDEFLVANLNSPFWDWAVVGLFYAALQYVEAYLANQAPPIHPGTHTVRDSLIQRDRSLAGVYVDYRQLEDESRDARYDASLQFSQNDVMRLQRNLDRVKKVIVPLIP